MTTKANAEVNLGAKQASAGRFVNPNDNYPPHDLDERLAQGAGKEAADAVHTAFDENTASKVDPTAPVRYSFPTHSFLQVCFVDPIILGSHAR
jgi:hypothetical protein